MVYESEILYRISQGHGDIPGMEIFKGDTVDISDLTDFEFYDLCWHWYTPNDWENPKLVRWLGVSHRIRRSICY